jgi:site-specific DNA-methyltransferase (adenine-specific)
VRPYWSSSDGRLAIHHGDALDVLRGLEPLFADAVLTDPPYSSGTRREGAKGVRKAMNRTVDDEEWFTTDCLTTDGFVWLMRAAAIEWKRHLVPGGHALSFIDWRMALPLASAMESADLRKLGMLIWDKTYFGMGSYFRNQYEVVLHFTHGRSRPPYRHDVGNVLRHPPVRDGDNPTERPVMLLVDLLSVVAPRGGLVLDCFAGSGSTLVAAQALGIRAVGIEVDERACERMARRLEDPPLLAAVKAEQTALFTEVAP